MQKIFLLILGQHIRGSLWTFKLSDHRGQFHGDDQLQDGQAAADHLQLLPLLPRRRRLHHR